MMNRNPKDNYRSTHQTIAQRVLSSPLAQFVGYGGLAGHDGQRLTAAARGEGDLSSWSFLSLEFRRADSNANLEVRVESVDRYYRDGAMTDKDGNEWTQYTLTCQVGYPSHGSTDVATVLARAELIREVAMLAACIQAEFGGRNEIWKMTRTAEQVAEAKAKAEAEKLNQKLRTVVDANRRQMRVGSERTLGVDLIKEIPAGQHEVAFGENNGEVKKYNLFVTPEAGACLSRVA